MMSIPIIGVVTALAGFALVAKVCAGEPKRAEKSEKAEIIKQLLALSERDDRIPAAASPVRFRSSVSNQGMRPDNAHRKQTAKTCQPIRPNKRT